MEQKENGGEGGGGGDEDEDGREDGDEQDENEDAGGGTPPRGRARRKSAKTPVEKSGDEQVRCSVRSESSLFVGFSRRFKIQVFSPILVFGTLGRKGKNGGDLSPDIFLT
jgi:hypothetical protein